MEPRNYLASAGANPPAAPAAPSVGYPQAAVPGVSQATTPGPHWFYKIGEELRSVIAAAGVTPSDADLAQVLAGLRRLHQWGDGIYAGDTGAADAYVVALTPAVTVAHDMRFRALIANTNTGASTIDFGIGAKQIVGRAAVALEGGEMPAGAVATFDYDSGADLVTLVDCTEGPQQVSNAHKSHHSVALGQWLGGAGWRESPDGLIVQEGSVVVTNTNSETATAAVTFPIQFPTQLDNIQISGNLSSMIIALSGVPTLNGFTVASTNRDSGVAVSVSNTIYWRATGK